MSLECPICQGTGFLIEGGADGVATAVRCKCASEQRAERLLRAARIPKRYDHCSFESFEVHDPSHETAKRVARDWAERFPAVQNGLLFLGTPGTGKTHLSVAVARELIRLKGVRVKFHEQRALLKALQGTFDAGSDTRESEVLGAALDAELLILDDLGAGRTTPWARDVLHDIIVHRYNEEGPLIMTSHHLLGDGAEARSQKGDPVSRRLTLADRLGDALISRVHEMCQIVRLQGKDYRSWILPHKHRV